MLISHSINLDEYDISVDNGFLPDQLPLQCLPDAYYSPWEEIMQDLPSLLKQKSLRQKVDALPVLSTSRFKSEPEWRRGYMVLCFLTHSYIWGGDIPSQRLPAAISVPLSHVADHFDLPCTATYAALNLWNYRSISPDVSLYQPENLTSLHTFTGTPDESWFYLISVAMEARGGSVIAVMMRALDAIERDDASLVSESLLALAECITELGRLLGRMYERCDPMVFYYQIRPFLAGSRSMTVAGLPRGIFYENENGGGEWRQYSGGSNAQSSLVQFFDAILGIEHHATGDKNATPRSKEHGFLKESRRYMPGAHARFLEKMQTSRLRSYVLSHDASHHVSAAYNTAVNNLAAFRETHLLIVTRYVIVPSRTKPPSKVEEEQKEILNLATASLQIPRVTEADNVALQGTGGTELMSFLKQTRDETKIFARPAA